MKKLEIVIAFDDYNHGQKNLERLFSLIDKDDMYMHYNIILDFSRLKNRRLLEKYIKIFSTLKEKVVVKRPIIINGKVRVNKNCLTFLFIKRLPKDMILEIDDDADVEKKIYKYRKRLSNRGYPVILRIHETEWKKILRRYRMISKMGIDCAAPYYDSYSEIEKSDFIKWVYEAQGSGLSVFYNACRKYLERSSGYDDCFHNSCLGKYIFIDFDGEVYCCKNKNDKMKFNNISNASYFKDIFSNDRFITIITNAITKRDGCKENCDFFAQCKGGCPIKNYKRNCNNESYKDYYLMVAKTLANIIETEDYALLNPSLRKLIFSSMVSGKLLAEKREINEN